MSIEINNESGVDVDESALAGLGRFVLDTLGVDPLAELSVVLLDVEAMAALHQQWMDLPGPTDVMAFPMDAEEGPDRFDSGARPGAEPVAPLALLGDVVLCPEVAKTQAASVGRLEAELHLLCAHGILHLLGYDHGEPDDEREMFQLQAKLLRGWTSSTGRATIRTPRAGGGGDGDRAVRDARPRKGRT